MKKILLFILLNVFFSHAYGKDYTLQLHLEGIHFDSLSLVSNNIAEYQSFRIYGESKDGKIWKFTIPDSMYNSALNFILTPKLNGDKPDIIHRLILFSLQQGDTLNYRGSLPKDQKNYEIYAQYLDTQVIENAPMFRAGSTDLFYATLHIDRCEIPFYTNSDFEVQAYYPMFPNIENNDYENNISKYLEIIGKYPNSNYLIGCIARERSRFKKDSLQQLYLAFSKETQQSDFGKIIDNHLKHFFTFSNMKLSRYDNDSLEFVVQDSTKMNLIVFSASWCAPCHEQIPALKEIYHNLKDRLDISYISMDETKTTDNWRKLMKEQTIPWRSLMAEHNIKTVQETYNPSGAIPFALLV